MPLNGFSKKEKMVSTREIEELFSSGSRSLSVYPVRAVFRCVSPREQRLTLLVSVSKRRFKHAVDRNRAKRQLRESFRLNKQVLLEKLEERNQHLSLAVIWMSDHLKSSATVSKSVELLLKMIGERL